MSLRGFGAKFSKHTKKEKKQVEASPPYIYCVWSQSKDKILLLVGSLPTVKDRAQHLSQLIFSKVRWDVHVPVEGRKRTFFHVFGSEAAEFINSLKTSVSKGDVWAACTQFMLNTWISLSNVSLLENSGQQLLINCLILYHLVVWARIQSFGCNTMWRMEIIPNINMITL